MLSYLEENIRSYFINQSDTFICVFLFEFLICLQIYPPDQPMVFNPQNPNAPPIYPCGVCHKEVHDNDQAILCESGCNFWFHR